MQREEITLKGLSYIDDSHATHDVGTSVLVNLLYEDGAIHPLGAATHELAVTTAGTSLLTVHRHGGFTHLITERQDTDHQWHYEWVDGQVSGLPHPITTATDRFNAITAVGDILCLVRDGDILYAPWDATHETYPIISRDDLLYDLTLTQTTATEATVVTPLPTTVLRQNDGKKILLGMESAIDTLLARQGDTVHKHVTFGIAALRLFDGNLTLYSNIFALIPPTIPQTFTVDADAQTMQCTLPLHRHFLTATMRHNDDTVLALVQSIDIFLTQPITMLAPDSIHITSDAEGNPTSISFAHLTAHATMAQFGEMPFYKAMTIDRESFGVQMAVRRATTSSERLHLNDFRRWTAGGSHACSYDERLHIAAVRRTIYNPLDIGLRYIYPTRNNDAGGRLCGDLPDTLGNSDGVMADVVMKLFLSDSPGHVVKFRQQTQYPLPGMMMFPCDGAYRCQFHVRVTTEAGQRQYVINTPLHCHPDKGFSFACYDAINQPHSNTRPVFLSLLFQQARVIYHDSYDHSETPAYLLWQEETAEQFDIEAAQASDSIMLSPNNGDIRSSYPNNPFVLPAVSHTSVGGNITAIATNTRRTADGQFGDCQYYLFTDEGIWVLKMNATGAWKAHQAVARDTLTAPTAITTTSQAIAFMSQRGLLLLRGTVVECISTPLHGHPFPLHNLPRIDDILQAAISDHPHSSSDLAATLLPQRGHQESHPLSPVSLLYDATHQRLILSNATTDTKALALVYALSTGSWGTIVWPYRSAITHGNDLYAIRDDSDGSHILRLDFHATAPVPVILCSQPLAMGTRHEQKRICRAEVTGVFKRPTLHLGTALYGSNDRIHWHLIGASVGIRLETWQGTPYRWYRLMVAGNLSKIEKIEGLTWLITKK